MEEGAEVIHLALQIGVEERGVTFAATPESVTLAFEFVRDFERFLHLRSGVGENVGVTTRRRAVHVARMHKQAGGAPEQFDAGAFLFFL